MKKGKWKKIYESRAVFICPYCLKELPITEATIEHEPPRSRQKELGESRTFWACKKCNNEKGALTIEEYIIWKKLEFIRNGGLSKNNLEKGW